jgi:hypothetical protein
MFKVIFFIAVILLVVFIIALIAVGLCIGMANLMIYFIPTIELADALVPAAILATVLIVIFGGMIKSWVGNAWAESTSILSDYYEDHQCFHIFAYPGTNRAMSAHIRPNKDIPVIIAF